VFSQEKANYPLPLLEDILDWTFLDSLREFRIMCVLSGSITSWNRVSLLDGSGVPNCRKWKLIHNPRTKLCVLFAVDGRYLSPFGWYSI